MGNSEFLNKKICIVGGGVSGLGCATYLQDMGYKNVTVLERNKKPGGKAHTAHVNGYAYDMGALEFNLTDVYTRDLMKRFDVDGVHIQLIELIDDKTGEISPMLDLAPTLGDKAKAVAQSLEYLKAVHDLLPFANGPTFDGLPEELCVPFADWLEANDMQELRWVFEGVLFTFGYGKQTELPAAYVLKFMHWQNFLTVLGMFGTELFDEPPVWPKSIDKGFQYLFEQVATGLDDLRLGVHIKSIKRDQPGEFPILVDYVDADGNEHTEGFDRLVVTALPAPAQLEKFLDITDDERDLFSNVRWNHYWSILIEHDALPKEDLLVLTAGGVRQLPFNGDPVAYVANHPETNIYVVNAYSEADTGIEEMRANIISTFERMGLGAPTFPEADGDEQSWNKWDFFPHVDSKALLDGFYNRVSLMQGQHDTYWTGGLYNFEVVESTLHNANWLANTHFSEQSWIDDEHRSVAIIGAGPAGLSAAYYLAQKGYKNVTVIEKEDWVGGKCHSYISDGFAHDMGALEITKQYVEVQKIMADFRVDAYPIQDLKIVDGQTGEVSELSGLTPSLLDKLEAGAGAVKYGIQLAKYAKWLDQPDMQNIPEDLTMPFGQWLDQHGMKGLREAFLPATFCYGYGNLDDYAAGYALKYMKKYNFGALISVLLREQIHLDPEWPKSITGGFQSLWEKVADALPDVRVGIKDLEIERSLASRGGVTIKYTRDGESVNENFDAVIVTVAQESERLQKFMELSDTERDLFDQVTHNHYYTVAVDAAGFPPEELYILKQNGELRLPDDGDPVSFIRHNPEADTLVMYCYSSVPTTEEEILEKMKASIKRMGGRDIDVRATFDWVYFPHVGTRSLRDGFYDKMHELQGAQNTYYSGGLMNFEDVENTVVYSKYLVQKFF